MDKTFTLIHVPFALSCVVHLPEVSIELFTSSSLKSNQV